VGLDIADCRSTQRGRSQKSPDLGGHQLLDLADRQGNKAAAEPLAICEAVSDIVRDQVERAIWVGQLLGAEPNAKVKGANNPAND